MTPRILQPCKACQLHEHAYTVGMQSIGNLTSPFQIFIDHASKEDDMRHKLKEGRVTQFLIWMCLRNGLSLSDYGIHCTLKCAPPKKFLNKKGEKLDCIEACTQWRLPSLQTCKSVLAMGEISCLAFTGELPKARVNCYWSSSEKKDMRVYVSYAPGYALQNPAESPDISRMIWYAAEHAGLKPFYNKKAGLFDWQVI